jgi:hypothetical protein
VPRVVGAVTIMEIVFRRVLASPGAAPAAGELHLAARDPATGGGMAERALAAGPAAFVGGPGRVERIVLPAEPTFDDLLAATFLRRVLAGETLPAGCAAFARYAADTRAGGVPAGPTPAALFQGFRLAAGADLTDPTTAWRFLDAWSFMAERIIRAAAAGDGPDAAGLFAGCPEALPAMESLDRDRRLYHQDVAAGETWRVAAPGQARPGVGLLLHQPRSALLGCWWRSDEANPGGTAPAFLGVRGGSGEWLFCAAPELRSTMYVLAERLRRAEDGRRGIVLAEPEPWRVVESAGITSVVMPRAGSKLDDDAVREIVRDCLGARAAPPRRRARWPWLVGAAALVFASVLGYALTPPGDKPDDTGRGLRFIEKRVAPPAAGAPGDLYLLAVGVSHYRDKRYDLAYGRADAEALAGALRAQQGTVFREVHTTVLADEGATREAIIEALDRLRGQVTQHDFAMVTLSGHGASLEEQRHFYFLPHDFDIKKRLTTGVYWDDFKRFLGEMPCRVLLVMDTCHSGAVTLGLRGDGDPADEMARQIRAALPGRTDRALIVMAACLSGGRAAENAAWGHGALSLALLEGIEGKRLYARSARTPLPTPNDRDEITLRDLDYYASQRVRELVDGKQAVVTNHTGDVALDQIPIARVPAPPR